MEYFSKTNQTKGYLLVTANQYMNWKRNISIFLASQTISLFGSSIVQYAIMWYITLTTQSGVMMTIGILCGFVPTFYYRLLQGCGRIGITGKY